MKTVSPEIVEKTWKKMAQMAPMQALELGERMGRKQPALLEFLLASAEDDFNQDERELQMYAGTVIWQIMEKGGKLPGVTDETIEEVLISNVEAIESMDGMPTTWLIQSVEKTLETYNQPHVLKYVVETLMEEDEEGADIREETKGLMLLNLKTVIDCLDK